MRTIYPAMVNPALGNVTQTTSVTAWQQYQGNQRGNVVFPSTAYTDLSLQQDFWLVPATDRTVSVFLKLTIQNVFNHQQQISWSNVWNAPSNGLDDPWVSAGTPLSRGNYGGARTLQAEAGIKF